MLKFRGQLQCRNGGKREGPIEAYLKFWNWNQVAKNTREVLRIPGWKKSFDFAKREQETILEWDVLPITIPEFPAVRRMTLGTNSPMVVPSIYARGALKQQRKAFTHSWEVWK